MQDEYEEWKALEARVSAIEAGEGPPLTWQEEERWGVLMDGWKLALEQAETAAWLLKEIPEAADEYLDGIERLFRDAGVRVPLWVGLARGCIPDSQCRARERKRLQALMEAEDELIEKRAATIRRVWQANRGEP